MKFLKLYWPYLAIFSLWMIFSMPYFTKNLVPFPSTYLVSFFPPWNAYYGMPVKNNAMPDLITQIFPWKKLTIDTWKRGEIPLWNPYSFAGTVHGGNYQSGIFAPANILFFVFPFITAWSLHILLQPLFAGIFTCMFLQGIKRTKIASVLGSTAFMFCGFLTTWMGYGTLGWAICFLPLSLFAIVKYSEKNNWWYGVLISLSIAGSLLSGHYQISMYLVIAAACFIFFYQTTRKNKIWLYIFLSMGMLLSLGQIFLTLHALFQSNRSLSFTNGSIPWNYLITIFSPDFFGNPVTRNDWYGQYAEWSSYIGVIPIASAVYSLFGKKSRLKLFFIVLSVGTLLFVMNTPVNAVLYQLHIPILSTSVATRMIVLLSFSLSILSAFGLDEIRHDWKVQNRNKILKISIGFIIFTALLWMFLFLKILPAEQLTIAKRNTYLPSIILCVLIVSLFIGITLQKLRTSILIVILLVASVDMFRFANKWMPFDPAQYIYPETTIISKLKSLAGNSRVFGTFGNELNTYYGIPSIEGYDAMYQQRYGEFISAAGDGSIQELQRSVVQIDKQGKYTNSWLDLLGVKYLLYRKSDGRNVWVFPHWNYPQYKSVFQDEKYEILENTNALPRLFMTSHYEVKKGKKDILQAISSLGTELKNTVILEESLPEKLTSGEADVTIIDYTPNKIELKTDSSGAKLLFLSDVYDNGWKVMINNNASKILRADYSFRAVFVPGGKNTVRFYYQPEEFIIGLWISGLTMVIMIVLSIKKLFYR